MNGIIHNCTHSDDSNDSKFNELTETDMFGRVLQYIDHIFSVVQPRKLLFLAIDGMYSMNPLLFSIYLPFGTQNGRALCVT